MIREAIRKSLSKFLFPTTYSSVFMPRSRFNYAKEVNGWQSSIIMACVGWIQRTFPEAPIMVQKRNKDYEWEEVESPLVELLDNPNPYYDGLLLQSAYIADLIISGNAYLLKVRSGAGRVVQLWWVPSGLIQPKWPDGGSEFISHYDYSPGGQVVKVDPKDVVHYRLGIDPDNLRKGRSPLQSLLREAFTDDEAANMTAALLKNMGVPGLLISPMNDTVSPQDADAVKQYVKERTTGDRRGEPIVIGSATKVDTFGFNPQQMDLKSLRRIPEERISAVLGVPAIVAGLGAGLDRSTFSNMAEAREMAYESGIIPLQKIVGSQTKHQLLSEFTDDLVNYRVAYDLSEIRVLQEDEDKLSTRTITQVQGGVCKVTDAQRLLGLPIDDSQDFYLRGFTVMPVRSGEDGSQIPQESEGEKSLKSAGWTEEQKTAFWKRIDRERIGWWGVAQQRIEPLYTEEAKAVQKAIKSGAMAKEAEKAINGLKEDWIKAIEKLTLNIVQHFGAEIAPETMGKATQFDVTQRLVRAWIASHAAESVKSILATNLDEVRSVILAGTEENMSVSQIGRKLRDFYTDRSPYKAMRVARTEVAQSAGFAQHESAIQSGVMKKHIWLSSRDDRVRDSHAVIDGEEKPINEPYSNGLMFPGDGAGDPAETIQCRCVERFTN